MADVQLTTNDIREIGKQVGSAKFYAVTAFAIAAVALAVAYNIQKKINNAT
jgi:hypothetical protein